MKMIRKQPKANAVTLAITGVVLAFLFSGCGSGGGDTPPPIVKDTVTVTGKVTVNTSSSPFQGAECRFVDAQGQEQGKATADDFGQYLMELPTNVQGEIRCTPVGFSNLALTTYGTTMGVSVGDTLEGEDVTLFSTLAAQVITSEEAADPAARKSEVLAALAEGQDSDLNLVAEVSEKLFMAMLQSHLDIGFTQDPNPQADKDSGGISGMVASGIEGIDRLYVPINEARCVFVADGPLGQDRSVLHDVVLADFEGDGRLSRADLQGVRQQINAAYDGRELEIADAFAQVFSKGIGQAYTTTTDANGTYFLGVPPGLPGYVCCTPPEQENLVLTTYVPGRAKGQSLYGQDLNPATTVHSVLIASRLDITDVDIQVTRDNYLENISALYIEMLQNDSGEPDFQILDFSSLNNNGMALAAFCGTALFNTLCHNQLNVDFPWVLEHFFQEQGLNPEFLTAQGVGADAAQNCSHIMQTAVTQAESGLEIQLGHALSTARIEVTVLDTPEGPPVPDQQITVAGDAGYDALTCGGCDTLTDDRGQVSLVFSGLSNDPMTIDLTAANAGQRAQETVQLIPLATQEVTLVLTPEAQTPFTLQVQASGNDYWGNGRVVSPTGEIDCAYINGAIEGDLEVFSDPEACYAFLPPGTVTTLRAEPAWWSTFVGWQGNACSGTEPVCEVTMDRHHDVAALFTPVCEEGLYDVWPVYVHLTASGDQDDDRIILNDNFFNSCGEFSATIADAWLTSETDDEFGFGSYIRASENPEAGPRVGTILYGGRAVTIAQNGQQCAVTDYNVSPGASNFDATGGTGTIAVRASATCPWQAAAGQEWITIISGASNSSGDGAVTYSVAANPGASRSSFITIAGTHHLVIQADAAATPLPALAIHGEGDSVGRVMARQYINTNLQTNEWEIKGQHICALDGSSVCGQCGMVYKPGAIVQLDAAQSYPPDWIFSDWTGSCSGTFHQCQVTMDQMHTVGARFVFSDQADLAVSELVIDHQSLLRGGNIDVVDEDDFERNRDTSYTYLLVMIENRGVEDAQDFSVGLYLSSDATITTEDILLEDAQMTVGQLSSKNNTDLDSIDRASIPADTPTGPAYLGIIIDEFNTVDEDIETNNTYSIPVNIVAAD